MSLEKPSIVRLFDDLADKIHRQYETIGIDFSVSSALRTLSEMSHEMRHLPSYSGKSTITLKFPSWTQICSFTKTYSIYMFEKMQKVKSYIINIGLTCWLLDVGELNKTLRNSILFLNTLLYFQGSNLIGQINILMTFLNLVKNLCGQWLPDMWHKGATKKKRLFFLFMLCQAFHFISVQHVKCTSVALRSGDWLECCRTCHVFTFKSPQLLLQHALDLFAP